MNRVLITGGCGFIGSHVAALLLEHGYTVAIIDNFVNSHPDVIEKILQATGKPLSFYEGDIRDEAFLEMVFDSYRPEAVLHFAGLKAVGESVQQPLQYYDNNIAGTVTLLRTMERHDVHLFVFSSSATVYGKPSELPLTETAKTSAENPYGQTKLMLEQVLQDQAHANSVWQIATLRYFNPVGAHPTGLLGENPQGTPNNLVPYVVQVAQGKLPELTVFGGDYDTPDGTGVRDYIHVMDLAEGHLAALQQLQCNKGSFTVNLGTGKGYSVLEVIQTFEAVNDVKVPYAIKARRPGDIAACYADASRAEALLGWKAKRNLADMCKDAWRFAQQVASAKR